MAAADARIHGLKILMVSEDPCPELDWEIEPITERHPGAAPSSSKPPDALESHVRLRAVRVNEIAEARAVLDEISDEQLGLTVDLVCLDRALEDVQFTGAPRGTAAVRQTLRDRARDAHELREALAGILGMASDHTFLPLFTLDATLADYLRGVYAWASAAIDGMSELVGGLRQGRPDWALFRFRLEEAKRFHMMDLQEGVRADLAALRGIVGATDQVAELASRLEGLFSVAVWLEVRLDQRLG